MFKCLKCYISFLMLHVVNLGKVASIIKSYCIINTYTEELIPKCIAIESQSVSVNRSQYFKQMTYVWCDMVGCDGVSLPQGCWPESHLLCIWVRVAFAHIVQLPNCSPVTCN